MSLTVLLLLMLALPAAAALELHVAPGGNDAGDGSAARPFATLERARDALREARPADGATVWVHPGLHQRAAAFALTAQDSGTADAPIVYRATEPGAARLLGGRLLPADAWRPVGDADVRAKLDPAVVDQVRELDLAAAGVPAPADWDTRFHDRCGWPELFFAGRRMTLARWPNEGWERIVAVTGGEPFDVRGTVGDKIGRFTYSGDRPSRWLGESDIWLHGYWFWDWSDQRQKVAAIDPATSSIELVPPWHHYGYRQGCRWYASNLLGELDAPGEWYVDRERWRLYFLPPGDPAAEAGFTQLTEPLLALTDVEHVRFEGLTFELSRGDGAQIRGGRGVTVAGCVFRNLGRVAVDVAGGYEHRVQSCDLYHLGAGGINLSGGDRATLTPAGHRADNNHIHHFAELAHTYQNAIRLNGVGCAMSHNLIHDTVHEALCYAGNDHLVELNEVYDVCLEADDSGVLHQGRDWTWRGNVVRHNFFHDVLAGNAVSNMGVYLDDMECGTLVEGNVLVRIPRAVLIGGGRDNTVRGNLIVDCPISVHIDNRAMNWAAYHVGTTMKDRLDAVPYLSDIWRQRYPALTGIWEDEPATPKGNEVTGNLMVGSGPFALAAEVTRFGTIADNAFLAGDPGFVDPAALDYRLRPGAAGLPAGFVPPPLEQMGLYTDAWRTRLPLRAPVIEPRAGTHFDRVSLALRPGRGPAPVAIRYTLDGTPPTPASPVYREPRTLTTTTVVRAIALGADGELSDEASATLSIRRLADGVPLGELPAGEAQAHAGLKLDRNYAGNGPVSLAGRRYERSLMLCPADLPAGGRGQVVFELPGALRRVTRLTATIGVDDAVKPNGTVIFVVEVRAGTTWREAYRSRVLRGGEAEPIDVNIAGAEALRLVTLDSGDNIHSDHAVWAEAVLW